VTKIEIAARLRQAGAMLRFQGGNPHRAHAYEIGAQTIEAFAGDLGQVAGEGRLTEIPGIGRSLAATITALLAEGRAEALERIMVGLPPGLLGLVDVPGFTPRRIRLLQQSLDVETVDDVRTALASGVAAEVRGLGPRVAARLRDALERAGTEPELTLLVEARRWAERLVAFLRGSTRAVRVEIAGSVRRAVETVGDVNLVCAAENAEPILEALVHHPAVVSVAERATDRCRVGLAGGPDATLLVARPDHFGSTLLHATGSAAHVEALLERARGRELIDLAGTEEDIYRALGLPFIPPELRENAGELEAADAGDRFADLVRYEDLRGAVHCHTDYSDGRHTIAQMAVAAERLGLSYLTVTDHSPAAGYAGGLSSERIRAQGREIDEVQAGRALRLLKGAECDILPDGDLDHDEDVRAALDVVIASIHERHKMDRAAMTERLIRGLAGGRFKIWGHPLGRLLLRRPPIECDLERVWDAAARGRVAVEINGSPARLDLPADLVPAARRRGLKFVISADAHSTGELEYLRYGVAIARRGGLRRDDVLNTLPAEEFARAVGARRGVR
jgi:DNA polymerase (family 10)